MAVKTCLTIAAALAGALALAAPANAAGVKIGVLSCNVSSGWGFVFGSSRDMNCTYHRDKNPDEHYSGKISKFGVDIGYINGGVMLWDVVAPASEVKEAALEGQYGGVTAGATAGVGGDVNVLIGGFDKSISLQPISVTGNSGVNLAAGIAGMDLKYQKPPAL